MTKEENDFAFAKRYAKKVSKKFINKFKLSQLASNPELGANPFSKWFFFYLNGIFSKGRKEPLQESDVPYPMVEI